MKSSTLAVGRLTHHDAEENPVEVVAALDDKTGAGLRFATTRPVPPSGSKIAATLPEPRHPRTSRYSKTVVTSTSVHASTTGSPDARIRRIYPG